MNDSAVSRRNALGRLGLAAAAALTPASASADIAPNDTGGPLWNVRDFKAAGDGTTNDTAAIQEAIERAHGAGGGTVLLPNGTYLSGTVQLRSGVTLHLEEGATLLGSPTLGDYLNASGHGPLALVLAQDAHKVAITGRGRINGQGERFPRKDNAPGRPFAIKFIDCQDVLLVDIRVEDSAAWVIHLLGCERAVVRGVSVWSHANFNNDGLDIDACTDVAVSQCHFDCQDDAICLKSTPDRVCQNVVISDCIASSHCNLIKMGTASAGGFRNITITNCVLVAPRYSKKINGSDRGIGGINLEMVDGGSMDQVAISNISMQGITLPLFIRLAARHRKPGAPASVLRNINLSDILATGLGKLGASITGLPGQEVENVNLSNITFCYEGGGTAQDASREVPEHAAGYPEGSMFGTLPSWGLYCRHVRGLALHNVQLRLTGADARHALDFDDVTNLQVDALQCDFSPGAAPLLRMVHTRDALIRGCRPVAPAGVFLKLEGRENAGIALLANDFRSAAKVMEAEPSTGRRAVRMAGNLLR